MRRFYDHPTEQPGRGDGAMSMDPESSKVFMDAVSRQVDAMAAELAKQIYAPIEWLGPPPPKPTRWQRLKWKVNGVRQRIGFWIAGYEPEDEDRW